MKNIIALALLLPFLGACQGVDRLINGREDETSPIETVIVGGPALPSEAPEFNLPVPAGYEKVAHFGAMPAGGLVSFPPVSGSTVAVFIYQTGPQVWFRIGHLYSDAFWYTYDAAAGTVQYHGNHLGGTAFCVYQYVPAVQP